MPTVSVLLFAGAAEAAGRRHDTLAGATLGEVLEAADARYGERFAALRAHCAAWVNGEPATAATALADGDEVAVLPPVSGGAR